MSNVPMTRPEEALAVHETPYFHSSTFVELHDGRILHAAGKTFTTSEDGGLTWAASTTPAQIRTLANGHLLVVWNQETEEEVKRGYNRTRISSAVSRNGGSVWEFFQNVESLHELKVLPMTWFYGGKEPADNPFLPRVHDPARP